MPSISKTDHCADRSIRALLSGYQEYPVTFKIDDVTSGTKSTATRDVYIILCPWGSKGQSESSSSIRVNDSW